MGHKSDDTFMHYISRISGVDVQSIMNNEVPDQPTIDYLRSMRTNIDFDAPRPRGSSLTDIQYWHKQTTQEVLPLERERQIYHDTARDIFEGSELTVPFGDAVVRGPPSRRLLHYLRFDTPRADYLDLLANENPNCILSLASVMLPLVEIAKAEQKRWYYPGSPLDESKQSCVCGKTMQG